MTFRDVLRRSGRDNPNVPWHPHDGSDISGEIVASRLSPRAIIGLEAGLGVIVAASDTPFEQRRLARFECDGVDDEEEFLAAKDAAAGGVIRALPGTYNFGATYAHDGILLAHGAEFFYQSGFTGTLIQLGSDSIIEGGHWNPTLLVTPTAPVIRAADDSQLIDVRSTNPVGVGSSPSLEIPNLVDRTIVVGCRFDDVLIDGRDSDFAATQIDGALTLDTNSLRNLFAAVRVAGTFTNSGTDNQFAAVEGAPRVGVLDYVERTAWTAGITSETTIPNFSLTATLHAGRLYRFKVYGHGVNGTSSFVNLRLKDDGTTILESVMADISGIDKPVWLEGYVVGPVASSVYTVTVDPSAGEFFFTASPEMRAFFSIEDVGAA